MALISLIKKNGKAKRNFIITGVCFVLFIVGVNSSIEPKNEKEEASSDDEAVEVDKKEEEEPKKEKPKEEDKKKEDKEKKEEKDDRTIDQKLQEDDDKVDEATLEDGLLTLKRDPGTVWSENSLFHSVYDLFESTNEAFKDDAVKEVDVIIETTMVDQKGNESKDPVIKYQYTKESFDELNYDNFTDMAFGQQWRILNEADGYFIHPGIYKELKEKYTDNLSHGKSKVRSYE